jgi:hypothetical protein
MWAAQLSMVISAVTLAYCAFGMMSGGAFMGFVRIFSVPFAGNAALVLVPLVAMRLALYSRGAAKRAGTTAGSGSRGAAILLSIVAVCAAVIMPVAYFVLVTISFAMGKH